MGKLSVFSATFLVLVGFWWAGKTAAAASTLTVNTENDLDDGSCDAAHCSLREAINTANGLAGPEQIHFALPASTTITLTEGLQLPVITDNLTILGNGLTVKARRGHDYSRVFEIGAGTAVTITRLTIRGGEANDYYEGGGIQNEGDLTLIDSTMAGNSAISNAYAGAIYNGSGVLTVIGSTFTRNVGSFYSGAIFNYAGVVVVENSTFSENSSFHGVGGITNWDEGRLFMNHVTMAENFALSSEADDFWNRGIVYMSNSIFGDCYDSGVFALNVNNLIEDGDCDPAYSGDPLLGPLLNYGGPTRTHTLLEGSQAIDNADPAYCLPTDQRGVPRPHGAGCDIGAFEGYYSPLAVSLVNFSGANGPKGWLWAVGAAVFVLGLAIYTRMRRIP